MQDAVANLFHKICLFHHFKACLKLALLHALLLLFLKSALHKAQKKLCGEAWLWGVLFETLIDEAAEEVEIVLLETKADAKSALVAIESCWSGSTQLDKHFSEENISFLTLRMLPFNVIDLRESVKTWKKKRGGRDLAEYTHPADEKLSEPLPQQVTQLVASAHNLAEPY